MLNLKACIFDLDGVIVDTARHHFAAWKELSDELVVPFTENDNDRLKGVSRVDSLEYILQKGNLILDSATKLRLMERKNALYLKLAKETSSNDILPGILPLMDEMEASNVQIGLGSSSKNARMILDKLNLSSRFDTIVDGNNITLSKPDPEVFLKAAYGMNVKPEECLVFEDAQSGVEAALSGGFVVVGVGEGLEAAHAAYKSLKGLTLEVILKQLAPSI
jgi:beta-phosphoglucomutase